MLNHILLIDDDEDEHLFFRWSLEKINVHIHLLSAYSSEQGMDTFRHVLPDIIFLDISMPNVNGFQCLQQLRETEACSNIPVYMYSTEINEFSLRKAMDLGASGCLKKSRDNDHLSRNIIEILNTDPLLLRKNLSPR